MAADQQHIRPQAIIFDCWNTLFYVKMRPSMFTRLSRRLLHHRLTYPIIKRMEGSLMTQPDRDARVAARRLLGDLKLPRLQWLAEWVASVIDHPLHHQRPYHDTFEVLRELKRRGYKLGMISNTYELTFEKLRREQGLDEVFEVITPSYEVGIIKPDPHIFEMTLERLGVHADEALMVGDSPRDDVQAAEAAGIKGVLIDRTRRQDRHNLRIHRLSELLRIIS